MLLRGVMDSRLLPFRCLWLAFWALIDPLVTNHDLVSCVISYRILLILLNLLLLMIFLALDYCRLRTIRYTILIEVGDLATASTLTFGYFLRCLISTIRNRVCAEPALDRVYW